MNYTTSTWCPSELVHVPVGVDDDAVLINTLGLRCAMPCPNLAVPRHDMHNNYMLGAVVYPIVALITPVISLFYHRLVMRPDNGYDKNYIHRYLRDFFAFSALGYTLMTVGVYLNTRQTDTRFPAICTNAYTIRSDGFTLFLAVIARIANECVFSTALLLFAEASLLVVTQQMTKWSQRQLTAYRRASLVFRIFHVVFRLTNCLLGNPRPYHPMNYVPMVALPSAAYSHSPAVFYVDAVYGLVMVALLLSSMVSLLFVAVATTCAVHKFRSMTDVFVRLKHTRRIVFVLCLYTTASVLTNILVWDNTVREKRHTDMLKEWILCDVVQFALAGFKPPPLACERNPKMYNAEVFLALNSINAVFR